MRGNFQGNIHDFQKQIWKKKIKCHNLLRADFDFFNNKKKIFLPGWLPCHAEFHYETSSCHVLCHQIAQNPHQPTPKAASQVKMPQFSSGSLWIPTVLYAASYVFYASYGDDDATNRTASGHFQAYHPTTTIAIFSIFPWKSPVVKKN